MEPRFVDKGAFTVVGAAARGKQGEFKYGEVWEKQYMPMDETIKPQSIDGGYYGVTLSEGDHLVYLAGMAVDAAKSAAFLQDLPTGAEAREAPVAHYAVFDCTVSTIGATWQGAYGQWLPASGYELDTRAVDFEFYPPHSGEGEMKVEIFIPVRVKEKVG